MEQRRKPSPALLHQIVLADQGPARCDPKLPLANAAATSALRATVVGGFHAARRLDAERCL